MANKNDTSDLVEFSFFTILIILVFIVLVRYGYSLIDKKYFHMIDAKISGYEEYIQRQWKAGEGN